MNKKWMLCLLGLVFFGFASVAQGQLGPMVVNFPVFQEGSPLVVIAVAGSISKLDMLNEVDLLNVSDKTIVGYQLGWVVSGGNGEGPGVPFYGMRFDANLKPGGVLTATGQGASFSSVQSTRALNHWSSALVMVGVVYVRFQDGTEWSYPLAIKRSFPEKDDPTLHQRVDPAVKSLLDQKRAQHARLTSSNQGKTGCASAKSPWRLLSILFPHGLNQRACTERVSPAGLSCVIPLSGSATMITQYPVYVSPRLVH